MAAVIFVAAMLTLAIAILAVLYGILRDVPPTQKIRSRVGTDSAEVRSDC